MEPCAHVIHRTRGRVRLRVREKRKDSAYFEVAREQLAGLIAIAEIKVNSTTGCILLQHPDIAWSDLALQLQQLGLFKIIEGPEPLRPAIEPLLSGIAMVDRTIAEESAGVLDLRTLAYVGLMVFTIRQVMQGNVLGPALPMLWNAMSLANRLHGLIKDGDA